MLVAQVVLRQPVDGRKSVTVASVHMHHQTAKKASGFSAAHTAWWTLLRTVMCRQSVDILSGDFNMSLWEVSAKLAL